MPSQIRVSSARVDVMYAFQRRKQQNSFYFYLNTFEKISIK